MKIVDRKDGCAYHCMQTEPGLDKFVGNASGVKGSLESLIRRAEKWVPYERHKDTPIFVLATAGLRRLDKEIARGVLDDIEAVVKLHEFKWRKDWIRVLSGEEEAYYGWIALNRNMGIFGNSSRLPTLGLLDLGGSSFQVATEIKQPTVNDHGVFRSKIGSFDHRIMAASLPAFGLNEAFDRTVVMLSYSQAFIERDFGTFEIGHPCLGYEFTQNYTCHGCFEGNLTRKMRGNNNFLINLVGEPNWEKCKLLARAAAVNLSSSSDWSKLSDDSYCTGLSSINGEREVSWTLGAALVEGKDLWHSESNTSKASLISYLRFKRMIFSPYFLFFILALLLFAVYRSQIKLPMLGRKATSLPSYFGPKRRPT
ncbi:hypothetical protein L1987_47417 [Smallanthus sonchifolius]|uniref:Uncharacterized protein n=1 Tax=Smallanthus sonchifolius TaxID=185202 RepID=A0ACB9G2C1_9ASTR|nr:hypothetical protein L1987_47417 [Smallanthus sonchifolius]